MYWTGYKLKTLLTNLVLINGFFLQYLYDLLMNLLEEKGISNSFVEKLGSLSTNYEHSSYIRLLESLSKFTVDSSK